MESPTLDFKRDLPETNSSGANEIAKDVSGFANADGGDLVYGIAESAGVATAVCVVAGVDVDDAILRITNVISSWIEPKIVGLRIHPVVYGRGHVLIVRVPKSLSAPHWTRQANCLKFFQRNGLQTAPMNHDQVRQSFGRSATMAQEAYDFVWSRTQLVADNKGPVPLKMTGAAVLLNFVPVGNSLGRQSVDLAAENRSTFLLPSGVGSGTSVFNFDGLTFFPVPYGGSEAYTHIFRNGALEFVFLVGAEFKGGLLVDRQVLLDRLRASLIKSFRAMNKWSIEGPALVAVTLLNVESYRLTNNSGWQNSSTEIFGKKHLNLPSVWVEDIANSNVDQILKPLADLIWQCFGLPSCEEYERFFAA